MSVCPPACGVATSVFGHRMTLTPAKLSRLSGTGIKWVEIAALQEQHLNLWDEERLRQIQDAFRHLPFKVWSLHAPFCAVAMDDDETRQEAVRRVIRAGDIAARLGAGCVVLHPGRDVPSKDRQRELNWTAEHVCRALEKMPDGVLLALETMGKESLGGPPEEMLCLLEKLPADRVGVCVDTGHIHLGFPVAAFIRQMKGRIVTVHLQDNRGQADDHLLAGSGTIDWLSVVEALKEADYRGALISEGVDPGMSPDETAREFVRRMSALWGADRNNATPSQTEGV